MTRVCTVCRHERRHAIDRALVAGQAHHAIAADFGVSDDAITRHSAAHLPQTLVKAKETEDVAHAIDVMAEVQRCIQRVNLLFDACDHWLRDADDPTRYDIGPRADDVLVTYEEPGVDGRPVRKKAPVSQLLARINGAGVAVERWETRAADPRELLLKTANQLQGQLNLVARLLGALAENRTANVHLTRIEQMLSVSVPVEQVPAHLRHVVLNGQRDE